MVYAFVFVAVLLIIKTITLVMEIREERHHEAVRRVVERDGVIYRQSVWVYYTTPYGVPVDIRPIGNKAEYPNMLLGAAKRYGYL